MKVGKEQIFGLLKALEEYQEYNTEERTKVLKHQNENIIQALAEVSHFKVYLKTDEAGREFDRVAISATDAQFSIRDLVQFLDQGQPSIRTRNHHLDQGYLLIDPRELITGDSELIVKRLLEFSL